MCLFSYEFPVISTPTVSKLTTKLTLSNQILLRQNYGVLFEKAGQLIGRTGETEYTYTFAVPLPTVDIDNYEIDLQECVTEMQKKFKCELFNQMVKERKSACFSKVQSTQIEYERVLDLIPFFNTTVQLNNDEKRKKRETDTEKKLYGDNTDFAGFVNKAVHELPGVQLISSVGNNVFGTVSKQTLEKVALNINRVGQLVESSGDRVHHFDSEFTSIQIQTHEAFNRHAQVLRKMKSDMNAVSQALTEQAKRNAEGANQAEKDLSILEIVTDRYTAEMLPALYQYDTRCAAYRDRLVMFTHSISTLMKGFLPERLVSASLMSEVLSGLKERLEKMPSNNVAKTKIVQDNPAFYYQAKGKTSYTRTYDYLFLTLSIPLFSSGGLLTVYKVDTFDVDVRTGSKSVGSTRDDETIEYMKRSNEKLHPYVDPLLHGKTKISNLPEYLAISSDSEYYILLTNEYYKSCSIKDMRTGSLRVCTSFMPALKHISINTCATAVFRDSYALVKESCTVVHTPFPDIGSASQIGDSNTFIVQGSSNMDDVWTLNCPLQQDRILDIKPRTLSLLSLPCYCSLSTKGFFLPYVVSGCDRHDGSEEVDKDISSSVRNYVPVNLYNMKTFADTSKLAIDLSTLSGDSISDESPWPSLEGSVHPIKIHNLTWRMPVEDVVEHTKKYQIDISKGAKEMLNGGKAYTRKTDKLIHEVKDFTDIEASFKKKNAVSAFKDLIRIFPGGGYLATALMSPGFVSLCACAISTLMFIARYTSLLTEIHVNMKKGRKLPDTTKHKESVKLLQDYSNDVNK